MTMSSLADRLAAASRDRATLPTSNDAMATMTKNERRGKEETKAENDFSELKRRCTTRCSSSSAPSSTTPS